MKKGKLRENWTGRMGFVLAAAGFAIAYTFSCFFINAARSSGRAIWYLKPDLLFLTVLNLFDMIPGGTFFGLLFFFLVIIAGLTTGVGLVEAVVVNIAEVFKLKRQTSIYVSTIVLFILAIPSILSQEPWSEFLIFGRDIFDFIDDVSGNILLTVDGLLIAVYVAVKWKFDNFMNELNLGTRGLRITPILKPVITVFIPVVIGFILLTSFL